MLSFNKHAALTLLALYLSIGFCLAQAPKTISGTLQDSTGKALHFATIELRKGTSTATLKVVASNDRGQFSFSGVDTGHYTVHFSHTGFAEKTEDVIKGEGPVSLPVVTLYNSRNTLLGVTVLAKKPLIEQADDKIVFNVENDPASKTENAIDILRKTPFVSVDGDGNVQVNGQSNFRVLLNGRETAMFATNVKEALKGFPGALITKIEVITSPSAKYDAEGVGGIINIITKKKVVGYNGSLSNHSSSNGWHNINTNLSAKFGKVGLSVNYGLNAGWNIPGRSVMETLPSVPTTYTRRTLVGDRKMDNFWNWGNGELSWELDTLRTLAFYGNISGGTNTTVLDQLITREYSNAPDTLSYYDLQSRGEHPTKSVGGDYIRKFSSNKEQEFTIRFNAEFGNSNTFLTSVLDNEYGLDNHVINNSIAVNRQYTLQSDYIYPLRNNKKIEGGVKSIIRRASSDFESMLRHTTAEDYKTNTNNTDNFNYNQDVYSAYGTFHFKVKKTAFRLGARLEHTEVEGLFASAKDKVAQGYTNILPNLQATVKLNPTFTLVFSYSDRIQRPNIWNLNPFRNDNDPYNISFGNPALQPQVIHTLSAQTRIMKGTTFAGITLAGSYSDNMIVQYATFDRASGVTSTTSGNLGKEVQLSITTNVSAKINPNWNVFLNGNIRYNRVENKMLSTQSNSGVGGNANLNTSYSINKRFTVSSYAGFWRGPVTIQTRYPLNIWYGSSMGYKLFKEKLTVSLGASNFLRKNRDFKLVTTDPNFRYTSTSTMPFRGLSLGLTWNFGKMTENVSKKKGITNDDQISSGQSQ